MSRVLCLGVALGLGLLSAVAQAAPPSVAKPEKSCLAVFKNGQRLEGLARLREAQVQYQTCAKSTCGTFLRQQCSLRYSQLESDIPSVVPVATDDSGETLADVRVSVDGEALVSRIDGRSVQVDPGLHEFSFLTGNGVLVTQRILIMQGQRNRPITVELSGSAAKAPSTSLHRASLVDDKAVQNAAEVAVDPDPLESENPDAAPLTRRTGIAPWLLGGLGLAGVGGYALLTIWGRKDNQLLGDCTPQCPQGGVDHIKKVYLLANISLGVGVAALAGATWLFIRSRSLSHEVATKAPSYGLDVQPVRSGALASLRGAF